MFLLYQPISLLILCLGFLWPTYHVFTSFRLVGQHSYHVSPFYHFIAWAFLAHLLLLYLFSYFYFHGLLVKFFGLPRPFYYIFTSYYPLGLSYQPIEFTNLFPGLPSSFILSLPLIILMGLLLHFLSFLNPFISSLPLIIFMGLLAINLATSTH